jgi:hypothetical protein
MFIDSAIITNAQMIKFPSLCIYGLEKDKKAMLDLAYNVEKFCYSEKKRSKKRRVFIYLVCNRDFKKLESAKYHNWINFGEFMKGKNKPFRVMATAMVIKKYIGSNNDIFNFVKTITSLNKELGENMYKLKSYSEKNCVYTDDTLANSIIEYAQQNNLFDPYITTSFNYVLKNIGNFEFIKFFNNPYSHLKREEQFNNGVFDLIIEILKGRKVKLNYEHYDKPKPKEKEKEEKELIEKSIVVQEGEVLDFSPEEILNKVV